MASGWGSGARIQMPKLQTIAQYSDPITQNQWYDGWDGTAVAAGAGAIKTNVEVLGISFLQAGANEDLEIRIIADDIDETVSQTAVAATAYFIRRSNNPGNTTLFWCDTNENINFPFAFRARQCQIMFRKTTAAGANDTTFKVIFYQIP